MPHFERRAVIASFFVRFPKTASEQESTIDLEIFVIFIAIKKKNLILI